MMGAMRPLLLALAGLVPAIVLLAAGPAHGEQIQIHAVIAMKTEGSCNTALGFVVESGKDEGSVRKQAEEKARKQHPQSRSFSHADNFKKDKYLGNYAVVVSAAVGKPGCSGRAMGAGFGKDEKEARKDAERLMGKMFPYRDDSQVKVEHSKAH